MTKIMAALWALCLKLVNVYHANSSQKFYHLLLLNLYSFLLILHYLYTRIYCEHIVKKIYKQGVFIQNIDVVLRS